MTIQHHNKKTLLLFSMSRLDDMLKKGNVWYLRHYEAAFEKVFVVYLMGNTLPPCTQGMTTLVSLGSGNKWLNLLCAPVRLLKFARKVRPTIYLTADLVFAWWTSCLVRLVLRAKVYLMPVCIPEQIYHNNQRSLSGMPITMERILTRLCFISAYRVITGKNIKVVIDWLAAIPMLRKKFQVIDILVDELPSLDFYTALAAETQPVMDDKLPTLIYVGRLHKEKLVQDLIVMMSCLQRDKVAVRLLIIGDGPEREALQSAAETCGVSGLIDFVGFKQNADLVHYYRRASVFISTMTGTSLREAALCGLPVVAYNLDWVKGFLVDGENALLAEAGHPDELAAQVEHLLGDQALRQKVATNLHTLALDWWGQHQLAQALTKAFDR